jgi:hypothetical protein
MSIEIHLTEGMLVVVEGDLEPHIPSSTDADEGHSPMGEGDPDEPRIVCHKPFGWGSGQEPKRRS